MPPSRSELAELERWLPDLLKKRGQGDKSESVANAMLRWAAADRPGYPTVHMSASPATASDQVFCYAIAGHVCEMALWVQCGIQIELERTEKIRAAERGTTETPPTIASELVLLTEVKRVGAKPGSKGQRPKSLVRRCEI